MSWVYCEPKSRMRMVSLCMELAESRIIPRDRPRGREPGDGPRRGPRVYTCPDGRRVPTSARAPCLAPAAAPRDRPRGLLGSAPRAAAAALPASRGLEDAARRRDRGRRSWPAARARLRRHARRRRALARPGDGQRAVEGRGPPGPPERRRGRPASCATRTARSEPPPAHRRRALADRDRRRGRAARASSTATACYVAGKGLAALLWRDRRARSGSTARARRPRRRPSSAGSRLITGEKDGTPALPRPGERDDAVDRSAPREALLAPPLVDEARGRLYLGTTDRQILEVSLDRGRPGWSWRVGADVAPPGPAAARAACCSRPRRRALLALAGRQPRLARALPSRPLSAPLAVGGPRARRLPRERDRRLRRRTRAAGRQLQARRPRSATPPIRRRRPRSCSGCATAP